jgi:hypothetical protein
MSTVNLSSVAISKVKAVSAGDTKILDSVFAFIRRFVSLSEPQARVVALWILHTHVFTSGDVTPYLAITSAEKQSGKSRLLEVLNTLAANPWLTGRVTPAVLYRKIDAEQPTLLLDESDAAFGGNKEYSEALRGILNTGHRRGGSASCCIGQGANISYRNFSTFCPKAIAGIGKLPDTVADRAIPIRLKRAAPGELVQRFRLRDVGTEAGALRLEVEAWCSSIAETLCGARPELPEALTDRQQDGAEPLLAIAEAVGGVWPRAAKLALVSLCIEAQIADDSLGKLLLADIRQILEAQSVQKIGSTELAILLSEIETSPWSEWSHGKPLSAAKLARLLRPFAIIPHSLRLDDKTPKGYELEDFQDAFTRYLRIEISTTSLPAPESATVQQANGSAAFDEISNCENDSYLASAIWPKTNVN